MFETTQLLPQTHGPETFWHFSNEKKKEGGRAWGIDLSSEMESLFLKSIVVV